MNTNINLFLSFTPSLLPYMYIILLLYVSNVSHRRRVREREYPIGVYFAGLKFPKLVKNKV